MKTIKTKRDWFKLKRYPHIGFPLSNSERLTWIEEYIKDPKKVATHSFLPFIHKVKVTRKFRKKYSDLDGTVVMQNINGQVKAARTPGKKVRHLYLAGHLESLIYSYYAEILASRYEKCLDELKISELITAYRKIPLNKFGKPGNKCNIDLAFDIFTIINNYPEREFKVITFDIKEFFDSLDHKILRQRWKEILKVTGDLPEDHFNVYKHITRFTYIDMLDIFKLYQDKIYVKSSEVGKDPYKQKRISKLKYLKKQKAVAYCTKEDFLQSKRLIKKEFYLKDEQDIKTVKNFGIPQGSPISAILANIYMLNFDMEINNAINSFNGVYRRYSDDMIIICPKEKYEHVMSLITNKIVEQKLQIQNSKTQVFLFSREGGNIKCGQQFSNSINYNKNLQYLGFEYDGNIVRLKSSVLSGFYRKMKRTIKRGRHYADFQNSKYFQELFKARILKGFSYQGAPRRRKYIWNSQKQHFEVSNHFDWGNFLSYSKKAEKIGLPNVIEKQTNKAWNKLSKLLR